MLCDIVEINYDSEIEEIYLQDEPVQEMYIQPDYQQPQQDYQQPQPA